MGVSADEPLKEFERMYFGMLLRYRPVLDGVRAAVYCKAPKDVGWLCDLMSDLGMVVVYAGFDNAQGKRSRVPEAGGSCRDLRTGYPESSAISDFKNDRVDLMVTESESLKVLDCRFVRPMDGFMGLHGLESAASDMSDAMVLPKSDGWRSEI
ncbi:MAG: hypothetical protein IJ856_07710 [Candidatus Methanomethylophilaceae archaeon]|nr:hypothetical protein [Candidatus Methanomethylophilaceae archaeon]